MNDENRISALQDGRTASIFLAWAAPIFDQVEKDLLSSLKMQFRLGPHTELVLACHVAQMTALDDLKSKIKSIALRGEMAGAELNREVDEDDGNHE